MRILHAWGAGTGCANRRTHYDLTREYTGSMCYWGELNPTRAAGMSGRPLYFGDSGMIGNPTEPADLDKLKQNVRKTIRIAAEYGFTEVYFYGLDGATGERLASRRVACQAVSEAGGKVIVSGWRGHFMWNYANPQTPVEDPLIYRRNYGLDLWKCDWDGAATYCYMDGFNQWKDFDNPACRKHNVAYPTIDGVVRTLALGGFREGLDDVRYATLLRLEIEKAHSGDAARRKAAIADAVWLELRDFRTADLAELRQGMIRRLLALRR